MSTQGDNPPVRSSEARRHGSLSNPFTHKHPIAFAPRDTDDANLEALENDASAPLPEMFHPRRSRHMSVDDLRKTRQKSLTKNIFDLPAKPSKIPLPRPYRTHREVIEERRAKKQFIYGKDEEYEFSEKDGRVPTPCSGILCFHTIELLDLVVNRQSFLSNIPVSYYCLLSIGQIKRITKIVHATQSHQVKIDSHIHLTIDVSEIRDATGNKIRVELWSFQDPEAHFIVGTTEMHIYHFIRTQHKIDWVHLWSDGLKVGTLAYEVAFSYGVYGYGHSNQLKNFAQPIMETISHSMFPRIRLDEKIDIADKTFLVRKPDKLKLFTYHSLILEVDENDPWNLPIYGKRKGKKGNHVGFEPKPIVVHQVEFENGFPVHCRLHMNIWQKIMQPDFNDMYGEYVCIGHKRERLEYLMNMVQGRLRDVSEEEAGPIFEYLKPQELEEIQRTPVIPPEKIFPKRIPCPTSEPFTLKPEDHQFQDAFPPIRREAGYLSKVFGYEKPAPKEQFLNDMDYPLYKEAKLAKKQQAHLTQFRLCEWIMRKWIEFKRKIIHIFYYIFPEMGQDLPIPEISLTVATPEGSTTNIFAYFTREYKDQITNRRMSRFVQHSNALMDKGHVKSSSSSDSEGDNTQGN